MREIEKTLKAIAMTFKEIDPNLLYYISIADPETEESVCVSNLEKEKMISFLKFQLEQLENISEDNVEVFEGNEIFETEKGTEH